MKSLRSPICLGVLLNFGCASPGEGVPRAGAGASAGGGSTATAGSSAAGAAGASLAGGGSGGFAGAAGSSAAGGAAGMAGVSGDCREPLTVEVPAWGIHNSGVYVRAGETVSITASGSWSADGEEVGPDGSGDDCDRGLWLRVGKFFDAQCVGSSLELSVARDGYLWFFQKTIAVGFDQQQGSLSVSIDGGNSCSGEKPEGTLSVFADPDFDLARLEEFAPVCGDKVPVLFDTDSPDDPKVQAYVAEFMGGDPLAFMQTVVNVACAVNYATPELAAHHGNGTMRLVHYLGAQKWEDLGRPPYAEGGQEYWDFALSFQVAELSDFQHYGPWGAVASTFLHESGHVLSPVGRVASEVGMPRWLNETYADVLADKVGYYALSHDNPENWVLYSRSAPWCDGYGTGSLFLDAVDRRHPGFLHGLSAYIVEQDPNPWAGSEAAFQAVLGQALSQTYDEYLAEYEITLAKPVADCDFPNDVP